MKYRNETVEHGLNDQGAKINNNNCRYGSEEVPQVLRLPDKAVKLLR